MNANVKSSRLFVTVILAVLGTAATAGSLVGCSSKSPLGSIGDAGDDVSSGSGGAGGGGGGGAAGTGTGGGAGGAGGGGGQSDGGSGETGSDGAAPVSPCPATSPVNGATCDVDSNAFCFYGVAYDQQYCRCSSIGKQWACRPNGMVTPTNSVISDCKRIVRPTTPASCPILPAESAVMCTEASSCDHCCSGGTDIVTCTCQPGQLPSCRRTGSCGG